jgi:hypothetical protein
MRVYPSKFDSPESFDLKPTTEGLTTQSSTQAVIQYSAVHLF